MELVAAFFPSLLISTEITPSECPSKIYLKSKFGSGSSLNVQAFTVSSRLPVTIRSLASSEPPRAQHTDQIPSSCALLCVSKVENDPCKMSN